MNNPEVTKRYHVFNDYIDLYFDDLKEADHVARLNACSVYDIENDVLIAKYIESYE